MFKGIANSFGELLSMDPIIAARRRLIFSRICFGVTQGTCMHLSIEINSRLGKWNQPLQYESIPFTYFHCKKVGHIARKCPLQIAIVKEKKEKTLQWKARNPIKKMENNEKEISLKEDQNIPHTAKKHTYINEDIPDIALNDKAKMN